MAENTNKPNQQPNQPNKDMDKGDQKQGQPVRDRDMDADKKMGEQGPERQKQSSPDQSRDTGKDISGPKDLDDEDQGAEDVEQDEDSRVTQRSPSQGKNDREPEKP